MATRSLAFLALLLAACGEPLGPVDRLHVSVSVSRAEIAPGDTTVIRIQARNPTARALRFETNGCVLMVEIRDQDGRRIYPEETFCTDILLRHRVEPGDELMAELAFDGYVWRRRPGRSLERVALPPGRYRIVGALTHEYRNRSRAVQLRILEPAPPG